MNSEFSFFLTICHTKSSMPYYLPLARRRTVRFILLPRELALCEMKTTLSRIWTQVIMSISNDDNHFTTGTNNFVVREFELQLHDYVHCWNFVTYWPLTELSIKRCTYVNKRKNSGSRWALNNNITRCSDGLSQLETRCRIESQLQTEGFGPSVTRGWATKPRWGRSAAMVERRTLGQNNSLFLSPAHFSHTTTLTLSRIKCERLYFYKEGCSFVHWSSVYIFICIV